MVKLPKLKNTSRLLDTYQVRFGGLNHVFGATDGDIYDMKNMTSDHYPVLSTRTERKYIETMEGVTGGMITHGDNIVFIKDDGVYILRPKSEPRLMGNVVPGKKHLARFQDFVVVMPDKIYVNAVTKADFEDRAELKLAVENGEIKAKKGDAFAVKDKDSDDVFTGEYDILYYNGQEFYQDTDDYWIEAGREYRNMQTTLKTRAEFIYNGTLYGEPAIANTIYAPSLQNQFKVGDAVTISGCRIMPENNITAIIREIDGSYLRFYENTFQYPISHYQYTADKNLNADYGMLDQLRFYGFKIDGYETCFQLPKDVPKGSILKWIPGSDVVELKVLNENGFFDAPIEVPLSTEFTFEDVTDELTFERGYSDYAESTYPVDITRVIPEMDILISDDNRLWGAYKNTIYASKLGDLTNFNVFDGLSTDSFSVELTGSGDITAAITYNGYPTFFKEDGIYRVYGDRPSNFKVIRSEGSGVQKSAEKSLAIVGEVLYYLSTIGIVAYSGAMPVRIDEPLGVDLVRGVAGGDGVKYYISATDSKNNVSLYVYDTEKRMWHKEDDFSAEYMYFSDVLYGVKSNGETWALTDGGNDIGGELEEKVKWFVEFADMTFGSPYQKGVAKVHVRFDLDTDAEAKAEISYDGGEWELIREFVGDRKRSNVLPVIPHRCDHFRIRLSGTGICDIYAMALQYYNGSENY